MYNICNLQVMVKGKRLQARVISKSTGLKSLTRSIGRFNRASIAKQAMADSRIRGYILQELTKILQREMTNISKIKSGKIGNKYEGH